MLIFERFKKERLKVNGIEVSYQNSEMNDKNSTVILLHGYPQCNLIWHKIVGSLVEKHHILAPDLRGYGESEKPDASDENHSIYCKRTTANDIIALADRIGLEKFHVVGHDRGARVGHRLALDHANRVLSLVSLDVMPSQAAFDSMDSDLAYAWFHWHLMRQPYPLPETLIGNSASEYFDFLMEKWCATENAIPENLYEEYKRLFCTPECVHATCAEYRSIALDLIHDESDRGTKLDCPVAVFWGADTSKRPGWQTGKGLDMLSAWQERAISVEGQALDCGHFIPEEKPEELTNLLLNFFARTDMSNSSKGQ